MNKNLFLSTALCSLCLTPFVTSANDKVEKVYNAQKYQQVCKGKSQGAPVSFAYRGIIWNGTCEPQFFPSSGTSSLRGDEPELYNACSTGNVTSVTINGTEMRGKCALGFTVPHPQNNMMQQNQTMPATTPQRGM
ncbi:MAG TPA: hypothetical protein K8V79_08270 [Acinetobacter lwoffii]|uniref:Uncharacterized protein n=1 Tax=Acinetobacter lwoffii TaxID=28090 RepID=A0A9D2UT56_ACILW|nr:hypothetical protein [Acinetobacter lwoffii]